MVAVRAASGTVRARAFAVHLDVADGETERIVPAAHVHSLAFQIVIKIVMLMEGAGEHHAAAEILVVGEHQFVIQVSDDRIGEIRLDPLDQVPVVDRALHPVLSERHERDGADPTLSLLIACDDDRVGAWHPERL